MPDGMLAGKRDGGTAVAAKGAARRLLICSTDFPHPSRGASMVVLHHYVQYFRSQGYVILHWIAAQKRQGSEAEEADYRRAMEGEGFQIRVRRIDSLYEDRPGKKVFRPVRTTLTGAEVKAQLADFRPDATFIFDLPGAALVKEAVPGPKVVWLGDLNFQTFWYHAWYAARERLKNSRQLPLAWVNSRAWRRFYRDTLRGLDDVIVCAKLSEKALAGCGIASTYLPFPWPCEPMDASKPAPTRPAKPTFLFLGNLVGLGSRSALHFLLGPLYRRLIELWGQGGFEIRICGTHTLPAWADLLLRPKPEMRYLGFVEDLDSLMRQCHGVIAPIDVPVGNRTRILTAMAARVPVIAHSNTALGNPALVDGETCLLADDALRFSRKMQRVFEDESLCRTLAEKAFHSYRTTFHPDTASALMGDRLLGVLKA